SEDNKLDEKVTATTTVEQQETSFQVNASATKPEQTTEDIIVQTQELIPTEQVVEIKPVTV
ncbi:unnamed protein product, partial [Rotaria magnacalcarata]